MPISSILNNPEFKLTRRNFLKYVIQAGGAVAVTKGLHHYLGDGSENKNEERTANPGIQPYFTTQTIQNTETGENETFAVLGIDYRHLFESGIKPVN
jgi:hypothetical protein